MTGTSSAPQTILFTNSVTLNGGDAAIVAGMLRSFRGVFGERTEFFVYDTKPEVAARHYPELRFRPWPYLRVSMALRIKLIGPLLRQLNIRRFYLGAWCWKTGLRRLARLTLRKRELEAVQEYASADLIVSTGGTYLVEIYPLMPHIVDYKLSLILGKPLVLFTQSLGPFRSRAHRRALRRIFDRALLVLLRDERSLAHVQDLGVGNPRVQVCADAAFALADEGTVADARHRATPCGDRLRIAVSVRDWQHFDSVDPSGGMDRYRRSIAAAVQHAVEELGAEVTFISTCQGIPEYGIDDAAVAHEIVASLPDAVKRRVEVDGRFNQTDELLDRLRGFDMAISTRMHFAILALCAGVPVMPVAYEFKTVELFRALGCGEWVQDIETIEPSSLPEALSSFVAALPGIKPELFDRVSQQRLSAIASAEAVAVALGAPR